MIRLIPLTDRERELIARLQVQQYKRLRGIIYQAADPDRPELLDMPQPAAATQPLNVAIVAQRRSRPPARAHPDEPPRQRLRTIVPDQNTSNKRETRLPRI
ncbi:hypothetical protein CCR75_009696 [Bremia lactucae]|uniref:Uncharacterized protein n=1 Tax=Bremia lactucae TaxID=4779 RepID=A0A976FKU8_BRELC|nr:hypothetical protein CCR75_009696 [Bremia lactucae]